MLSSSASAFWSTAMVLQLGLAGWTHASTPPASDPDSETTLADSVFAEPAFTAKPGTVIKPEPVVKPRITEPELKAPKGSLVINSNPPGAQVIFNAVKQGGAPVVVKLTKSLNRIVVKMHGYETYDAMIEKNTLRRELTVNLKPDGKTPVATASPGAKPAPEPVMESKPVPATPPPSVPAPAPVTTPVPTKSESQPAQKPSTPPPAPSTVETGSVFFSSSPSHAVITLDGKATGKETPIMIELSVGIHHVEMEHDGLKGATDDSVNPGSNKALHLQLQ